MSSDDIEPFDWYRRLFGPGAGGRRGGFGGGGFFDDMFRGFDQMRREMEREFEGIEKRIPKDLVREYNTPEGGKVREVGPFVYGYSMTIGPDGRPKVREFGNVKSPLSPSGRKSIFTGSMISSEREPLADITSTNSEIKVIVEMPGVNKENIKVNPYDNSVEIITTGTDRKYHEVIEIPPEADIETAKSVYKNGILEITFKKKEQSKPRGKQINIE